MAGNNGGPWGGGGNRGGSGGSGNDDRNNRPNNGGPRRPGDNQIPEIDELLNKGREQFRVLMGGGNGGNGGNSGGGQGPSLNRSTIGLAALAAVGLWAYASFYTVKPEEQSVELFLGEFSQIGNPGLNFAPWPVVTREIVAVSTERNIEIGTSNSGTDAGLMLTGDENIVDIDFQVVWNINDPQKYLFNLADPGATIAAVSESAMREIIAQSELAPILNVSRESIAQQLTDLVQTTLDSYDSGVNIIRINFDRADPPAPVIEAFRAVQDAEQERDRVQSVADAYANRVVAEARGKAEQILQGAEAYRAQVVNAAKGDASRFTAILQEYQAAPDVTRRRMYLETMEQVLGGSDITILQGEDSGVVPYLPLPEVRRTTTDTSNGGAN